MSAINFDADQEMVSGYELNVRHFIPGYDALHDLTLAVFGDAGDVGHALVVGAGGGLELEAFARRMPGWRFTGVDPSHEMLSKAADRLAAADLLDRVDLVYGIVHDVSGRRFDAGSALLSLHFVPDDGQRLGQLSAIRERLRRNAPFVLANGSADVRSADFSRTLGLYAAHARLRGAEPEVVGRAVAMQADVAILPPSREETLLGEAGFREVEHFFQALHIHAWAARA